MYFDLSIPFLDPSTRLHSTIRAFSLGYTSIAFDLPSRGNLLLSDLHRCKIPKFPISSFLPHSSTAAFHRSLLSIPTSSPFRQYTRITVSVDRLSAGNAFNNKGVLRTFDLVAAKPLDQDAFDLVCQVPEIDIITLDFPLKLRLKIPMVQAAIKRGVYFEIAYCGLVGDARRRKEMLSDARLLVEWTRGKNLIISSSAASVNEIRGPHDIANLSSFLLGLSMERAKAAISRNCRSLVASALRKKDYKEAIRIERILPDKQLAPDGVLLSDWVDWDPISSGEGDLPSLEEISKLFAAASKPPKSSPAIDFVSCASGLPFKFQALEEDRQSPGEITALHTCTQVPVSATASKITFPSTNEAAHKDGHDEVPVDSIPVAMMPIGEHVSVCEGNQVSPSDTPELFAESKDPATVAAGSEHLQSYHSNKVVSDATGMPSCNLALKCCTTGEENMVSYDLNLICSPALDDSEPMLMEDNRITDAHAVANVTLKAVTGLAHDISSVEYNHTSSNGIGTFFTSSLQTNVQKEHIIAKIVDRKQNDEVMYVDGIHLLKDLEGPAPNERREGATNERRDGIPSLNDFPLETPLDEMKEQEHEHEVVRSSDSDALMEEVFVKYEERSEQRSAAADGEAPYTLKSGNRRRKRRPIHPLPLKGLLNTVLLKKKVCQSRRSRKHL